MHRSEEEGQVEKGREELSIILLKSSFLSKNRTRTTGNRIRTVWIASKNRAERLYHSPKKAWLSE
jgi:hypothetical protein